MHDAKAVAQAVAALFDVSVGVGVTDPRMRTEPLMPGEDAHLGRAMPKRQLEFAAGRTAARQAMTALGHPAQAVRALSDRAPVWPDGLHGSISHSDTLCVAVVTSAQACVGVDVEPATPLNADLVQIVTGEHVSDPNWSTQMQAKRVFSAKEAAFKAQYAITGAMLGFEAFDVSFSETRFDACFTEAEPPFVKGDKLLGRHSVVADHFVTAVTIKMPV